MKVMMVFNGLNSLMALSAAIVLYSTYLGAPDAKWSIYVAAALCSVIAVHQLISFIFAFALRLRSQRIRDELSPNLAPPAGRGRQFEVRDTRQFIEISSVTENTTEILQELPRHVDAKPQA